jgi:type II secretory pathway component PulK
VQSLPLLEAIMRDIGYSEEDAAIAAAAVVDWVDPDDISSGPGGAEEEGMYYARLAAEEGGRRVNRNEDLEPVRLRNEGFQTVDELLDVYGVTPELYFGPGSPEAERYEAMRPEPARGDRFQIRQKRNRQRGEKPVGLRDYFTTFGSGRLNINTAPAHVLGAYFAAGGATDGMQVAESFVRKRGDGRGGRRSTSGVFKSFAELQADGDIYAYVQAAQAAYPADIRSDLFRIRSTGTVRDVSRTVEAMVHRESLILTRDERFEATDRKRRRERQLGKKRTDRRRDADDESLIRYPAVRIIQWTE